MLKDLLHGELVRLSAEEPEVVAKAFSRWARDSEYWRLMASMEAMPLSQKAIQKWFEKDEPASVGFLIRTLDGDRMIGDIGLDGIDYPNGNSWVGIGIGEREYWGKGYGADAMRLMLRYAFMEMNLQRVSLSVFEYNPRAIRSYEKVGFKHEGRSRQMIRRDGQWYDILFMGILRDEWVALNA